MPSMSMHQFKQGMGTGPSRSTQDIRLVNCYQVPTPNGRSEVCITDLEGNETALTVTPDYGAGNRGEWRSSTGPNGVPRMYFVAGDTIYRATATGSLKIGNVVNNGRRVTFCENQDQTGEVNGFVCDGYAVYSWKLKADDSTVASTFAAIDLPYVNGSSTERAIVSYISYNTYRLILTCQNTSQWFFSDLNSNTFRSVSFETSESNPDDTIRVQSFAGNLWAISRTSFDIFGYTGLATDPFNVVSGGAGKVGCVSGDSLAVHADYMMWLGQGQSSDSKVFMATPAGGVASVSNLGIERIIQGWEARNETIGFFMSMNGLTFYVLTSKRNKQTLAYCVETKMWNEFADSVNGSLTYWDVCGSTTDSNGKLFISSFTTSGLLTFKSDSRKDHLGHAISRFWQGPVFISDLNRFRLVEAKIDVETGTAFDVQYTPQIYVKLSWDGGRTFGQRKLREMGLQGEYKKQVSILAQGSGYALVMRIGTSSEAPFNLFQIKMITESAGR